MHVRAAMGERQTHNQIIFYVCEIEIMREREKEADEERNREEKANR